MREAREAAGGWRALRLRPLPGGVYPEGCWRGGGGGGGAPPPPAARPARTLAMPTDCAPWPGKKKANLGL
jgi:hypothetical protein